MFPSRVKGLYREEALQHLNAGESFQHTLRVVHITKWRWLLSILLVLIGIIAWSVCSSLIISVEGKGIVISADAIAKAELLLRDISQKNQENIAHLKDLYEKKHVLYQHHYITLEDLLKTEKEYLLASESQDFLGSQFLSINNDLGQQTQVLVFVEQLHSGDIKQGNEVKLKLSTSIKRSINEIRGVVAYVSPSPVSKKIARSYLNNSDLVDDFFNMGSPILVKVYLNSQNQINELVKVGEVVNASITIEVVSPVELIKRKK